MIDNRRLNETKEERHDLFTALLDANMEEEEVTGETPTRLTDSELIGTTDWPRHTKWIERSEMWKSVGNIFIFLLAGHEVSP